MYDTSDYADSRIAGTIVMNKRKPIYVERVRGGEVFGSTFDKEGRTTKVPLESIAVLSPNMQLGFLNKNGVAYHLSRKALRHDWRQGLRPNNVLCEPYKDVSYADIAKCLLHRYPTFSQAVAHIGEGAKSCAWCPDFCIKGSSIIWKLYKVGTIEDATIKLDPKFKFLSEVLKENTHECYEII